MDKSKLECVDCNPPRSFRSVSGYNGHMQFKHDKTGVFSDRLPGKQTEMIQQLLDQQEHLLNQQDELVKQQRALYSLIAERVDNRIGVFSGGNGNDNLGNGNPGNNNGNGSGNGDQGDDEQVYSCEDCKSPVDVGEERCRWCKARLNWNGVAVN